MVCGATGATERASRLPRCRRGARCDHRRLLPLRPAPHSQEKDKHLAANMARFAFCKEDASLLEANRRLLGLKKLAA